jgi:hypothetical protein
MYRLHKFLWELRRNPDLAERFRADPDQTMRDYGLDDEEVRAIKEKDFSKLYRAGVNPYILLFGAVHMGVPRQEYYERVRSGS